MTNIRYPLEFESAAAKILVDDLGDVEEDDTARVVCLLDELIEHMEAVLRGDVSGKRLDLPPDMDHAGALWLLRDLRRREPTARELRAMVRRALAKLASEPQRQGSA